MFDNDADVPNHLVICQRIPCTLLNEADLCDLTQESGLGLADKSHTIFINTLYKLKLLQTTKRPPTIAQNYQDNAIRNNIISKKEKIETLDNDKHFGHSCLHITLSHTHGRTNAVSVEIKKQKFRQICQIYI